MVPISIVPMTATLARPRGLIRAIAFVAGVFVTYTTIGVLAVFGLDAVFARLTAEFTRVIKHPNTLDFVLQIAIGLALLIIGQKMASARRAKKKEPPADVTPWRAFVFAAGLVVVGAPGALPYFAAIDQVLRADLQVLPSVVAILFYNLVFVAPLVAIILLRVLLGRRADGALAAVNRFMEKWGRRIIMFLLIVLGLILVVDGVGWFVGRPLIPVGWPN